MRPLLPLLPLLLGLGCTASQDQIVPGGAEGADGSAGPDGNDSGATDEDPSGELTWDTGFLEETADPAVSMFTGEELAARLEATLAVLGDVAPHLVYADYVAIMAKGDELCPGDPMSYMRGLEGCTADTGYTYTGKSEYVDDDLPGPDGSWRHFQGFLLADFVYIEPDGTRFFGSGRAERSSSYTEDGEEQTPQLSINGSWRYPKSETLWLAQGLSSSLSATRELKNGALRLNGGLASGDAILFYDGLSFEDLACPEVPTRGSILLRQPDGSWNTLTFRGGCDPCFDAVWDGELSVGSGCVDLAEFHELNFSRFDEDLF